jgi:hypothetical protein
MAMELVLTRASTARLLKVGVGTSIVPDPGRPVERVVGLLRFLLRRLIGWAGAVLAAMNPDRFGDPRTVLQYLLGYATTGVRSRLRST